MKILTFDIEDWFHILDNPYTKDPTQWEKLPSRIELGVERILQLLEETNCNATFFCLGWIAEKYPDVIKKISESGYHVGTHSYAHQLAYNQTKKEFENDLYKSISILSDITGKPIDSYRAPGFSIKKSNLWAFEILYKHGIKYDSSVFPANRAHGGFPEYKVALPSIIKTDHFELKSMPINTTKFFGQRVIYSGGGYFRFFPSFFLEKRFKNDNYIMTYFHPRDFDKNQPKIPGLNMYREFKCYVGIRGAYSKLKKIIKLNDFEDIPSAANKINWKSVKKIEIDFIKN